MKFEKSRGVSNTLDIEIIPKSDHKEEEETHIFTRFNLLSFKHVKEHAGTKFVTQVKQRSD